MDNLTTLLPQLVLCVHTQALVNAVNRKRILVINDDPPSRDSLTRLLKRRGFNASSAADGASGLALAASERPDLVLLDLALPDMSGVDAAKRLRAGHETASIRIIATTASVSEVCKKEAMEICDAFFSMPGPIG